MLKRIYSPRKSLYKHLHFKGVFSVVVNQNKKFKIKHYGNLIENEIFWGGIENGFEKVSLGLWVRLCENSEYIFDIGANTGLYALIAKTVNKNSKVFAFEPVQRVYEKLQFNIQLNNYDIVSSTKAISNQNGDAVIYDVPELEHIYSVTVNKDFGTPEMPTVETRIQTVTLDSIIKEEKLNQIDLIKIDVETHEPEVIEGYLGNLIKHKPAILIEVLNDEIGQKIEELVRGVDYLYFNIDEDKGVKKVDSIMKSDYYNYLLCTEEVAKKINLI